MGTITIIVQKSGCNQTNNNIIHIIIINGKNPFVKLFRYHLYFLKNDARYIIIENLRSSVGCIVNGSHGILIHHLAHPKVIHISSTIISRIITNQKICFAYFSKNE
jgi:hypothetical protein